MPSGLETLQLKLQSIFDRKGFDEANQAVDETAKKAEKATDSAKKHGSELKNLGRELADFFGVMGMAEFLKDSVKEYYENEKAMRGVTAAARQFGASQDEVREKVDKAASSLALFAGVGDDEVIRSVGQQYKATGDLEQALSRASLASVIAAERGLGYAEAEDIVLKAVTGRTKGLDKLIGLTAEGTTQQEKAEDAVRKLTAKYKDANVVLEDHALKAARTNVQMQMMQEVVGSKVGPAINTLKSLLIELADWAVKWVEKIGAGVVIAGQTLHNFAQFLIDLPTGPRAAWKKFTEEQKNDARDFVLTLSEIDKAHEEDKKKYSEKASAEELAKRIQALQANKGLKDDQLKIEKEFHDYYLELLQARVAAEEDAGRRLMLEKEVLDQRRVNELIMLQKKGQLTREAMDAIDKKYDLLWAARLEKRRVEWSTEQQKEYEEHVKNLMMQSRADEARQRWLEGLKASKEADDERAAREEIDLKYAVAEQSIQLGATVFGQHKAFQVAGAIVDTYRAAAGQLASPPVGIWNIALAAVMIATGLAQVARILSANPERASGKGFDDPSNDAAAYLGGRKWAKDMIERFSSGASGAMGAGWAQGMGAKQTIDNSRHVNVTLQGAGLIDPMNVEMVKQFSRTLRSVERNIESQRTLASPR